MLHFLRRIRRGLIGSGATRKYLLYAVGEIALVVIGILIALQINNWNEERKIKHATKYILEELIAESKKNLAELESVIDSNSLILFRWENLKRMRTNSNLPSNATLGSLSFFELFSWKTYNPSQGLISSLSNTSKFQLINDLLLRRQLINWSGFYEDYKENEIKFSEHTFTFIQNLTERVILIPELDLDGYIKLFDNDPLVMNNKINFHCVMLKSVITESNDLKEILNEIISLLEKDYSNYH